MKPDKEIPKGIRKPEDRGLLAEGLSVEHYGHPKQNSATRTKSKIVKSKPIGTIKNSASENSLFNKKKKA